MKKLIFPVLFVTSAAISFISCEKKDIKRTSSQSTITETIEKINICPLSDINASNYSSLGVSMCGSLNGQNTIGEIDVKLNCNQTAGTGCNPVSVNGLSIRSYSTDPMSGTNVLSDGIMTVTEQQSLISAIQTYCNTHKNANYGSNYIINHYDVWYMQALCGGCPDGLVVMVDYEASKPCK